MRDKWLMIRLLIIAGVTLIAGGAIWAAGIM
jgi:hypothetical protein